MQADSRCKSYALQQTNSRFRALLCSLTEGLTLSKVAVILLGTAVASFGIHNIHQQVHITEGGILGLILLLNHWFLLSPAILTPLFDLTCYVLTAKHLGKQFIRNSALATVALSAFYWLWELFPPMLPDLSREPLLAAVLGGIFVGVGVGLVIRQGGSCGGDDALALLISKLSGCRISRAYLATDLIVLFLSLSYIPLRRIAYSLITVTVSSMLIDFIKSWREPSEEEDAKNAAISAEEDADFEEI